MKHILCCLALGISVHILPAQSSAYIQSEKAREDIDQLTNTFERVHYNPYFKTGKEDLNKLKNELLNEWATDSITMKEFMGVGMKLAATMSGGHSYMYWQNEKLVPEIKAHSYIPFTGTLIDDYKTFIITKSETPELSVGAIVHSINGLNIIDIYKECMSYKGGIDAFKNENVEEGFPVYAFFNEDLKPPYSIKFEGSSKAISTEGLNINELAKLLNAEQDQLNYTFEILDDNIGLISYNSCTDYKKFKKFLKETFQIIADKGIDKLIIDIRENGGGDSSLNDLLLNYLTETPYRQSSGRYWKVSEESKQAYSSNKVYERMFGKEFMAEYMATENGEVFVDVDSSYFVYPEKPNNYFDGATCFLIGPSTFSSANFLVDAVKTFQLSTLIGKPTGEYTNDFGEQLSFTLSHSGARVFISSTYDIGANGNASALEPVYPDIEVEGDALEYAIDWIKQSKE